MPNAHGAPKPVALANPGVLSAADYGQLKGLTVDEKIQQMRAILEEVRATRTPQQIAQFGQFIWEEADGPSGEAIFIGAAPLSFKRPTVIIIGTDGKVHRMLAAGLTGLISQGPPKIVDFDLNKGMAQLMVS